MRRSVASNPIVRFIADALRFYFEFHARYDGFYGAFIHDPLRSRRRWIARWSKTRALFVDVEPGELATGETVADWRRLRSGRRTSTWHERGRGRSSSGSSNASAGWRPDRVERGTLGAEVSRTDGETLRVALRGERRKTEMA